MIGIAAAMPAHAATYKTQPATPSTGTPDSIAAAFGDYDFDKGGDRAATDFRLEYQWGASLLSLANPDWSYLDRWFQIHPEAGFEGADSGMTYFNGGLNADVPIYGGLIFTWGEAVGLYGHGDSNQPLGSPFEVRSQLELGYQFDNNMRLSGYISHMSNAGVGDRDPGAETVGAYLRVPVSWLAHK